MRLIHVLSEVKEGFGNQINLCRYRGLNPGLSAQKSGTLTLDHQVTILQIQNNLKLQVVRLGSALFGSARFGSVRLGSARLGSKLTGRCCEPSRAHADEWSEVIRSNSRHIGTKTRGVSTTNLLASLAADRPGCRSELTLWTPPDSLHTDNLLCCTLGNTLDSLHTDNLLCCTLGNISVPPERLVVYIQETELDELKMFRSHSFLLVLLWMTSSDAAISTNGQHPVLWQSSSLKDLKDQPSTKGFPSWSSDADLVHPQQKNGPSIVDIILNRPVKLGQEEDAYRTKSYVDAFIFRQLNRAPKISIIGPFQRISTDKEDSVSPLHDSISSDQDEQKTFSGELLSDKSYPISDVGKVKELKHNTNDKTMSSYTSKKDVTEQKHDKKEIPALSSTGEGKEVIHAEEDSFEKETATTEAVYLPRGIPPYWSPSILGELPVSLFRMPANEEYQLSDGKYTHSFIHGHTLDSFRC
uniref:Uncharacterized protein n=1 Tax=Timema genevievae TaxID=629358 RepID=A0A7R9PKJ8_TIMGE|nr:unnamed protein product [Timema genevievae]